MGTVWTPLVNQNRVDWLLANGEIITTPLLEETPSGRKVRIAEQPSLSAYRKDMDEMVRKAVGAHAASKGTRIAYVIDEKDAARQTAYVVGDYKGVGEPTAYMVDGRMNTEEGRRRQPKTSLWWRFRHPLYPLYAQVTASVQYQHYRNSHIVNLSVTYQLDERLRGYSNSNAPFVGTFKSAHELAQAYAHNNDTRAFEFYRDNPLDLPLADHKSSQSERLTVSWMLDLIRKIESLDTLPVPAYINDDPGYVRYVLWETNVTAAFVETLKEYLDNAPSMAQAAFHYGEMLRTLRATGLTIDEKTENDFLTVLLGENGGPPIHLTPHGTSIDEKDRHHTIVVDVATGTFAVQCDRAVNQDQAGASWQEASTIASLTGREDELLAYARAAARVIEEQRIQTTIDNRKSL